MRRCVVIGGAPIHEYETVRAHLQPDDFCIFCDCGLRHRQGLCREPDLIVGDFDSHERPKTETETILLPCEKDDTDTAHAVKEGLSRGFDEFLLLGVIGGRIDHTLGNITLLLGLDNLGKQAKIVDDFSELEIVSRKPAYIEDRFPFFSLLAVSERVRGVCVEHAKYPLSDAELAQDVALGISNEPLPGETARVSVREGQLLLVRDRTV